MRTLMFIVTLLPLAGMAASPMPAKPDAIDWDLVLKALGFIVAAAAAYLQVRNLSFAARASLKTDLEILKLIDSEDPNHRRVKSAVDERIAEIYALQAAPSSTDHAERWAYLLGGGIWTMAFAYWTISLSQPTFSWWSLLTGYLTLAGVGFFGMGISGRRLATPSRRGRDSAAKIVEQK